MAAGTDVTAANLHSHVLPWSAFLALAFVLVSLVCWRQRIPALAAGGVVLSHIALDLISGRKPLGILALHGVNLARYSPLEFVAEALLLTAGWLYLRRREPTHVMARWPAFTALFVLHAILLTKAFHAQPYATRCLEAPIQPCWIRRNEGPP